MSTSPAMTRAAALSPRKCGGPISRRLRGSCPRTIQLGRAVTHASPAQCTTAQVTACRGGSTGHNAANIQVPARSRPGT
jgi:hypothetical protein